MDIKINSIRTSINNQLNKIFNISNDYNIKIYDEEIKQGLKTPAFFVKVLKISHDHLIDKRYKRYHSFDIHYFVSDSYKRNYEVNNIAELLYRNMELLQFQDFYIRGHNMSHEYFEGILHFFIDYDLHLFSKDLSIKKMNKLNHIISTKGDDLNE